MDDSAGWSILRFDEVIDFQEGPGILAKDFRTDGVPLIRLSGLQRGRRVLEGCDFLDQEMVAARWEHFKVAEGDVLLSTSASLGRIAIVDEASVGAIPYTGIIRMRPRSRRVYPDFIPFLLESPHFQRQIEAMGVGSVIRHFGPSHLRQMTVLLPAIEVQRRIAEILGALDDRIELDRRMNETLEAMARALFKSWFVDFDPVHAKAEGRPPSGMDAEVAKLFPREFVDSEIGPIPRGWRAAPLREWVDALSGGTPSKADEHFWNGPVPWISPKVMTSIHADEAEAYVTESAIGNGTRLAPAGSTLIMVRGMGLHEEVRVSQARAPVTFNQDVKALVPRGMIQSSLLLFALVHAKNDLLGRVESSGHGTGRLPSDILLATPIVMPPKELQAKLAAPFDALNDRIAVARDESRTLAETRNALLPRLLSGELRVRDAERIASIGT